MWYMYVLQCNDESLYTGITTDVSRRLYEHNSTRRGAKYTRGRRPVALIYVKKYETRSLAQRAECRFKKLKRSQKLRIIS